MADNDQPRVTIAAIAAEAGVSVPTVSKVLNGRADVSAATRATIERIVAETGYRRRRGSSASPVPMIDLVFHELGSPWAIELIQGVEEVARLEGAEVVLSECGAARRPRQEWIDSVLSRQPTGVIMVFSDLAADQRAQLDARQIPYVVVDPVGEDDDTLCSVGSGNFDGGRLATGHLIALGHRRVAAISGPMDTICARARMGGYADALRSAGIAEDPALIREGDFNVEGGYRAARELLALPKPPTAVFAGSDLQALGVMRAARELGLDLPDDLSIVGYDDLPLASWVWPALTTVDQPLRQMAITATRQVFELSRGVQPITHRVDLAVRLVVRQSTVERDREGIGSGAGHARDRTHRTEVTGE